MLSELLKVQLNSDLIRLICFINYLIVLSSQEFFGVVLNAFRFKVFSLSLWS